MASNSDFHIALRRPTLHPIKPEVTSIGAAGSQHYILGLKNGATHLCEIKTNAFVRELQTYGNEMITSKYDEGSSLLAIGCDNKKVGVYDKNAGDVFTLVTMVEV